MNAALRGSGVRVRDWSGTQWVVEHASGATIIVDSVAEVWAAGERLSRRRIDPLDCAVTHGLSAPDCAPGALVA
jgi:hypothetical protein